MMANVKEELNATINHPVTSAAFMAIVARGPFFGPVYRSAKDITFRVKSSADGITDLPLEDIAGDELVSPAPARSP